MSQNHITTAPQQKQPFEEWLLAVLDAITTGGRVEPRKALIERAEELLATFKWQGIKKFCEERHILYPSATEKIATNYPNLPDLLRTQDGVQAILDYPKQHPERIRRFHDKVTKATDFALSVSMGQIQDKEEIWEKCSNIIAEGETREEEAGDER